MEDNRITEKSILEGLNEEGVTGYELRVKVPSYKPHKYLTRIRDTFFYVASGLINLLTKERSK